MTVELAPNPAGAAAIQEIRGLREEMRRLTKATERQLEDIFYLPQVGTQQRISASRLVLNCNTPGVWALGIGGSATQFVFESLATTDTLDIPFPHVIQPGQRITIINTATGAEATIGTGLDFHSAYIVGSSIPNSLPNPNEGNLVDG